MFVVMKNQSQIAIAQSFYQVLGPLVLLVVETTDLSGPKSLENLTYKVVLRIHLPMSGIRTQNFSGDGPLSYDHDHDHPFS